MTDKEFLSLKKVATQQSFSEFAKICQYFGVEQYAFFHRQNRRYLDRWELYPDFGRTSKEILNNPKLKVIKL